MTFDDMHRAVDEAKATLRLADTAVDRMAYIIRGRLRACDVPHSTLVELKRELADYNMHTGKWKDAP